MKSKTIKPWPRLKKQKKVTQRVDPNVAEDFGEWLIDEEHDSRHSGQRHPFVVSHLRHLHQLEED